MKEVLSGKKSYVGGVSVILIGIAGIVLGIVEPNHAQALELKDGLLIVFGGLTAVGIGHKIQKVIDVFKAK